MRPLYISASQLHDWQDCERKWLLSRLYESRLTDWSLVFGGCIHEVFNLYLLGVVYGFRTNPHRAFRLAFDQRMSGQHILWGKKFTPADVKRMGLRMIDEFIAAWKQGGYEVVSFRGKPMLEARHQLPLQRSVILTGFVDCIAWSPKHGLVVFDFKTAASFSQPWFASVSPQLSAYILLFEDLLQQQMDGVGFYELKKNKVKTTPAHINVVPRHSEEQLDHTVEQIHWMADDIRNGRFPARVRMAWNTPCGGCNFRAACHEGKIGAYRQKKTFAEIYQQAA